MKRQALAIVAVTLGSLFAASLAWADLTDSFVESPAVSGNWCERHLAVLWNSDDQWMQGVTGNCCKNPGLDGTMDCNGTTCEIGFNGERNFCQSCDENYNAIGCEHLLITQAEFAGDERSASIEFAILQDLQFGPDGACPDTPEHVKIVSVAHPECDARIEARVYRLNDGDPGGEYVLEIRSITNPLAGYPECEEFNAQALRINEPLEVSAAARFGLTTSTTPNYELNLLTVPSPTKPGAEIDAVAEVVEISSGTVVATITHPNFFRPAWYNVAGQGRRYAVGGARSPLLGANVLDNFDGSASIVFPPDPTDPSFANGAPSTVDPTVSTTVKASTSFLYDPQDPMVPVLQSAYGNPAGLIDPEYIELERAAVIRGLVQDGDGNNLPDVTVSILEDQNFGQTRTRVDGRFDLAVNGGRQLTVVYEKNGYFTAHRKVRVPWQNYVEASKVMLVQKDPVVSIIDLSSPNAEAARGSVTPADDADSRQATVIFPPGTQATMFVPGTGDVPISTLSVRATEYTVGPNGPDRMPAQLPPDSAYTYAVELSVDEAEVAGATRVDFSQPVYFYLENFLNFTFSDQEDPQAHLVPMGYYDRETGNWVPSDSGRFVRVKGETGGMANLDVNGDDISDAIDVAEYGPLGITAAERTKIWQLYSMNEVLWRVPIRHFSIWDANWAWGPPGDGGSCGCATPSGGGGPPASCQEGSIIGCQPQSLGERVSVTGTPFDLVYDSRQTRGYAAGRTVEIYVEGANSPTLPPKSIELEVEVAGQFHRSSHPAYPSGAVEFTWDGKDAYGREITGRFPVRIRIGYTYDGVYRITPRFLEKGYLGEITGNIARMEVTLWEEQVAAVEVWDARGQGLGGWALDNHVSYDPASQTLQTASGTRQSPLAIATITAPGSTEYMALDDEGNVYFKKAHQIWMRTPDGVETLVAGVNQGFAGDDIVGGAASAKLNSPTGLAIGPDGALYVADSGNYRIRRIDLDTSTITSVVGPPCSGAPCPAGPPSAGDGLRADDPAVRLTTPHDVEFGPEGTMYISFSGRIRSVSPEPDFIIDTIAGTGSAFSAEDHPTGNARLSGTAGAFHLAVGPDGLLYFPSDASNNYRVRRIGADGKMETVAGQLGPAESTGDGGPATSASLNRPRGIAFGPDGSLYIAEMQGFRVRRVSPGGIITTVAGSGTQGAAGDDGPPGLARFQEPRGVKVGPDGNILIADWGAGDIRRVAPSFWALGDSDLIASEDGREVYEFDGDGRHTKTYDALTGATLFTFSYTDGSSGNPPGLLASIADRTGANVTTIERSLGVPMAIVAPGGQRTELSVTGGYLDSISSPALDPIQLAHSSEGLLEVFTDERPEGYTFNFSYDSLGRLTLDQDPDGGSKTLTRTPIGPAAGIDGGFTVDLTTGVNRTFDYLVERFTDESVHQVDTYPDGTTTEFTVSGDGVLLNWVLAEGTEISAVRGPEVGRFGFQAPVWTSVVLATPGMKAASEAAVLQSSRTVTLQDPTNPLTVDSINDDISFNGRTRRRSYHGPSRTLTETSPVGRVRYTRFDAEGRVIEREVDGLNVVQFAYDASGRLETVTIHPTSGGEPDRVYTMGYDSQNRLTSVQDPVSGIHAFSSFTGHDLPRTITLPDLLQVGLTYDEAGNLKSLTPPARTAHAFDHNGVGRETQYIPPQTTPAIADRDTLVNYNLDRQIESVMLPGGDQLNPEYDPQTGRLESVALPGGAESLEYRYELVPDTGQVSSIVGPAGGGNRPVLSLGYDGFLETVSTWTCETAPCPAGTVEGTVAHTFDERLYRDSQTIGGEEVLFSYDDDGLLAGVGDLVLIRETDPTSMDFDHGGVVATTLASVADSTSYNRFGEVSFYTASYQGTDFFEVEYLQRDGLGRIVDKTERIDGDLYAYNYGYDSRGRLDAVTVTKNGTPEYAGSYSYDGNGNRVAGPNLVGGAIYDEQDRLCVYGDTTYLYGDNGELALKTENVAAPIPTQCGVSGSGDATQYTYDALGNLREIILPSGSQIEYVVDGIGRRIGKKVNGVLVRAFLYESPLRVAAELDVVAGAVVGTVKSRFVYGEKPNVPEYMVRDGITYRIVADELGSVRFVVDSTTGSIVQRMEYDEFGRTLPGGDTNPGFQPFGFAGGLYDSDDMPSEPGSGLVRFGARDYDPEIGRWTAKDPIRFEGSFTNLYQYVNGDPVNRIDPFGLGDVIQFPPGGRGTPRPYWMPPPLPGGSPVTPLFPPYKPWFPPFEPLPFLLPLPVLCAEPTLSVSLPNLCPPPCA